MVYITFRFSKILTLKYEKYLEVLKLSINFTIISLPNQLQSNTKREIDIGKKK